MNKLILTMLFLLASSSICLANIDTATISENDVATTTYVSGKHLAILNQGTNEIYVEIAQGGTVATATTSSMRLDANEGLALDSDLAKSFTSISTVCDSGETATISYAYWD